MSYILAGTDQIRAVGTALRGVASDIQQQMSGEYYAALSPIFDRATTYPEQPEPADPRHIYIRGQGAVYVPTGRMYLTSQRYGQSATLQMQEPSSTDLAQVEMDFPATYSGYLRGTVDSAGAASEYPAWMHVGVWERLQDIIDELWDGVTIRMNDALTRLIQIRRL